MKRVKNSDWLFNIIQLILPEFLKKIEYLQKLKIKINFYVIQNTFTFLLLSIKILNILYESKNIFRVLKSYVIIIVIKTPLIKLNKLT